MRTGTPTRLNSSRISLIKKLDSSLHARKKYTIGLPLIRFGNGIWAIRKYCKCWWLCVDLGHVFDFDRFAFDGRRWVMPLDGKQPSI